MRISISTREASHVRATRMVHRLEAIRLQALSGLDYHVPLVGINVENGLIFPLVVSWTDWPLMFEIIFSKYKAFTRLLVLKNSVTGNTEIKLNSQFTLSCLLLLLRRVTVQFSSIWRLALYDCRYRLNVGKANVRHRCVILNLEVGLKCLELGF